MSGDEGISPHNFGALKPLPEGYWVGWVECVEHFMAFGPDDWESVVTCDPYVVAAALARNGGRSTATARELGMSRIGFYRLRDRLGMPKRKGGPVPVPEDWRERLKR